MSCGESGAKNERSLPLEGKVVRLEPLRREHTPLLWKAAKDHLDDIFRWIPYPMHTAEDFQNGVDKILQEQAQGQSVAFVTIERSSGRVIGSTRFMNMDLANRRVEIGSTWIAPAWQRTAVNTEAKYLPRLRAMGMPAGRAENRLAEPEVAQRQSAPRRQRGRHAAPAYGDLGRPQAGLGVLQHSRRGVAGSEAGARNQTGRLKLCCGQNSIRRRLGLSSCPDLDPHRR